MMEWAAYCVLVHKGIFTLVQLDKQLISRVLQFSKTEEQSEKKKKIGVTPSFSNSLSVRFKQPVLLNQVFRLLDNRRHVEDVVDVIGRRLQLLVLPIDVPDGLDDLRQLSTVLVEVSHLIHLAFNLVHYLLQLVQRLQALLNAVQLRLNGIAQLRLNGRLVTSRHCYFEEFVVVFFFVLFFLTHFFSCYLPLVLV